MHGPHDDDALMMLPSHAALQHDLAHDIRSAVEQKCVLLRFHVEACICVVHLLQIVQRSGMLLACDCHAL
jgi:hypothetical protein